MIPNKPKTCSGQSKDVIKHTVKAQQRAPSLWVRHHPYDKQSDILSPHDSWHKTLSYTRNPPWLSTLSESSHCGGLTGLSQVVALQPTSRLGIGGDKEKNTSSRCLLVTTTLRTPWGELFGVCFEGRRFSYNCFFGKHHPSRESPCRSIFTKPTHHQVLMRIPRACQQNHHISDQTSQLLLVEKNS